MILPPREARPNKMPPQPMRANLPLERQKNILVGAASMNVQRAAAKRIKHPAAESRLEAVEASRPALTRPRFDMLRFVETLKSAGFSEAQSKAQAEALAVALGEASAHRFATKEEVQDMRLQVGRVKSELRVMQWLLGFNIACVLVTLLALS